MLVVAARDEEPIGFLLMTDGHIDMLFMDPTASGRAAARFFCRRRRRGARAASNASATTMRPAASTSATVGRWTREYEREFAGQEPQLRPLREGLIIKLSKAD